MLPRPVEIYHSDAFSSAGRSAEITCLFNRKLQHDLQLIESMRVIVSGAKHVESRQSAGSEVIQP